MISAGLPATVAEDNAKALALLAQGYADYVTDDVPALLGRRPARTVEQPVGLSPGVLSAPRRGRLGLGPNPTAVTD